MHQLVEDKKMASNPALQVSVSFGRFENDSLSWEKWSSFSPNKYLEEVEKCATPGSVAQKKAYFEAHYKNIAARKAELLAQEKQTERDPFGSPCQDGEDLSRNTCGDDADFDVSNSTRGSIEGAKQETNSASDHVDKLEDGVAVSDYHSPWIEGENEEVESRSKSSQKDTAEDDVSLDEQQESPKIEAKEDVKKVSQNVKNETEKVSEVKAKDVKFDYPKASKTKKVTPVNKESNATKRKQKPVAPPTSKASQISAPRSSRPTSTPSKTSAFASKTIRGSSPTLSATKVTSTGENRKVPNKSLHMSLSLGPSKPNPAPISTSIPMRKSFIMEKMGDKDIVKRAFKTFQNSFNQSKTFGEDKSLVKKQVTSRGAEPRAPTSTVLRKEDGEATKVDSMDKRSGNAVRTTSGLKSNIRAEKGKESPRKIEEKSNVKEGERTHLQLKSKEEKLKHNFKATPMPAFYRGQKVSKGHSEKGEVKIEKQR